ncbi:MAG: hypothetical protein A2X25_08995 [Chloroflexi bacterium GWB2_49_20]|nr:MAG: hypothetical protein A2X25_08995 [Chloroflexi bacterium GWB2_49_20]OGN79431.1 MAG: hypothetical protein A2X26_05030 [Chloroflexi bacterium GWC2_49_37]OGN82800.1 MAG: hypothetical protein A2X27_07665 [Chloroflexi bacterium GWD2_49_16]HCC79700.1 hypothetical protein [Anaerolineae bacterium]HCM97272.1 hypothetical protein [Anaerolineae bacterium]
MEFKPSKLDINQKVLFLKKCHLFRGLTDEQLDNVADAMDEIPYPADKVLIKQGTQGEYIYMIHSGSVRVTRSMKGKNENLASLVTGDYFGEEALLTQRNRTSSVTTLEDSVILALPRRHLEVLFAHIPKLKANFEVARESRRLIRKTNFGWIQPDEVIYFLACKHPILLWQSLATPLLVLLGALFLFWFSISSAAVIPLILAWIFLVVDGAWGLWKWVDWGNDYYIVTNKRVIWLEKVIGIYDSRQEAPLNTILSVGVETDQIGRILDYGDVIVRTFVGRILFHHVRRPNQAASLVEEHWVRSREISQKEDASAMKQAIRERLGLVERKPGEPAQQAPVVSTARIPGVLQMMFSNIFKVRFEDSGTITYRKHWFVLLKTTWQPVLVFLLLLATIIYRLFYLAAVDLPKTPSGSGVDTLILVMLVFFAITFVWWLYKYLDWHNDIYQVTPDQIFDIDKTPLGREERRAAPLDNILSTEYKRIGIMQVLLNFGNVYITVGGAQLVFEDVSDPPAVQQDIDERRIARISQKQEIETRAERDRMADWFAAYHNDADSFRGEAGQGGFSDLPEGDEFDVQ